MIRQTLALLIALVAAMTFAQTSPQPPVAPREPKDVTVHGDRRVDDYFWMRERDDPRTLPHLRAENAYADAWFAPHAALKEKLYQEMFGRIQQDDDSVPYRKGQWWYSTRTQKGEQYPRYIRRRAAGSERAYDPSGSDETMLDLNELARGQAFLRLGLATVSRDAARLAYTLDLTGGRDYTLRLRELATGKDDAWSMPQVASAEWANDSRTLYYVTMDPQSKRADKLWRHVVGAAGPDTLVLEEKDELFDLGLGKTRDEKFLVLTSESKDANEQSLLDADAPADKAALRIVFPRRADVEYHVDHRAGSLFVRINDTGRNFRLVKVDAAKPDLGRAEQLIAARDRVMLDDFDLFAEDLVVTERVAGSLQLRVVDLVRGGEHTVAFDEQAYTVHTSGNAEFETRTLRFVYDSMTTPASTYDYRLDSRERVLRKRQPVPGYDPALYQSERVMAKAADGTEIPVSLVWRRDLKRAGPQPLLLYGYGSYGIALDPWFSQSRVSLLDRGVIYAIAHTRGGGDLGRTWYEAGKMGKKQATFSDFIACAEALIARGLTSPKQLAIEGGSAGGLLMGVVVNQRPELFKAVIAEVPFVDVITTMLDETIPLTVGEFIEWGNPKLPEQYAWMRAYSPYDNLRAGAYPAMLVRSGLNDTQVAYWEPAKYVARLRSLKTDSNPLLFKINLEVGHGGASGRFDSLREIAEDDVFLLVELGLVE
ncbi:MAG: S9 family peptidase [Burkholderiales bacterium]|nr:S9 family peptidase [Burkholderiales bacterium]